MSSGDPAEARRGGPAVGRPPDRVLPPEFYARPAAAVARDLLGRVLLSEAGGERTAGRIVETEAYTGPEDAASHAAASIGRTERNDPLFGPPGTAYVHLNYGIHWCLNAVTTAEGCPAGVLIRALEPTLGLDVMERRRGRPELTSGPARLTEALGIGPELQRHPLQRSPLRILEGGGPVAESDVIATTRIGISRAADLELRFYERDNDWVSRR
ncbi:MAG: DNA-3-methyladenine glycosylase [Candidatus Palauibacterales bacterium]|nr:DNA-3-methyladenine glycosylase [Candidatus Palauibacterales bacterium]MDP2528261.1 DNA-3-methyladenine glycosylase [Candidatus Palauibacterales bacterium]MDP2584842.1 DNA-3-methyladenine glycosylase [Candidatus Palauibacterales bacterium]